MFQQEYLQFLTLSLNILHAYWQEKQLNNSGRDTKLLFWRLQLFFIFTDNTGNK